MVGMNGYRPEAVIQEVLSRFGALPTNEHLQWAEKLLKATSDLYGAALESIVEGFVELDQGQEPLERLAQEDLVAAVLLLHDLHPFTLEKRIQIAIERLQVERPGSDLRVLGIDPYVGVIHLRVLDVQERWGTFEERTRKVFDRYAPEISEFRFERPVASIPINLRKGRRIRSPALADSAPPDGSSAYSDKPFTLRGSG